MAARQDSASRLARVKGSWTRQGDGAPGNRKASPTYRKLNTLPEWRNGKRSGFKIRRPNRLEGSSPSSGTGENPYGFRPCEARAPPGLTAASGTKWVPHRTKSWSRALDLVGLQPMSSETTRAMARRKSFLRCLIPSFRPPRAVTPGIPRRSCRSS